jgi:hypothetical protein
MKIIYLKEYSMQITPIKTFYAPKYVVFKGKEKTSQEESIKKYSGKEVTSAVLATALSATLLTGAIIRGKNKSIKVLAGEVADLKEGLRTLEKNNSEIIVSNSALSDEVLKLRAKLKELLLRGEEEIDPDILEALRIKIKSGKLSYDPTKAPIYSRKPYVKKENGLNFDSSVKVGPANKVKETPLEIPEIGKDGRFVFEIPSSSNMQVEKCEMIEFTPMKNVSTSISEKYADAVQWDNDKIVRDILQNFYDGHGQTIDGVRFEFKPLPGGKYKIKIIGKATYTPDKAVYIGESTKRENSKAAGNYGEGLKMAALKLLRDKGADSVVYGSGNWRLDYTLTKGTLSDRRVLTYSLDKTDFQEGNFVEFVTDDFEILESFRKSINRFNHSKNVHFANMDFQNDVFGIKILPEGQKGGIYIAGQRLEYNGDYDGLEGAVIYIKEKPPVNVLDLSRDRTSINESQLKDIAQWLSNENTTREEKLQVMKVLEPYFRHVGNVEKRTTMDIFLDRFVYYSDTGKNNIKEMVNFPEKYVAYSACSEDIIKDLISAGYVICKENFSYAGMRTIKDLIGEVRDHKILKPNKLEEQKISIIRRAIYILKNALKKQGFSNEEIDTRILLFNAKSTQESEMYKHTLAEAIINDGKSKGFYLDKKYLEEGSFSDLLETTLHELCHKVGGDSSAAFSYKLTDVNRSVLDEILHNSLVRQQLQALDTLWKEVAEEAAKKTKS